MSVPSAHHRTRAYWRLGLRSMASRPRLFISLGLGVAVGLACATFQGLRITACIIYGWDTFCLVFMGSLAPALSNQRAAEIRLRSERQDEGQGAILALVLAATAVSVAAIAFELSMAKHEHGPEKALHVLVAFLTVGASWMVMQVIFALHYAHEFYRPDPETRGDAGGLLFPGDDLPDYWDFLHFSIVIGVAAQTADIAFADRRLRRLGTVHSLIAFAFNTLIVALTINLVAGLF
jgi:uncharacterized membrane protein